MKKIFKCLSRDQIFIALSSAINSSGLSRTKGNFDNGYLAQNVYAEILVVKEFL